MGSQDGFPWDPRVSPMGSQGGPLGTLGPSTPWPLGTHWPLRPGTLGRILHIRVHTSFFFHSQILVKIEFEQANIEPKPILESSNQALGPLEL